MDDETTKKGKATRRTTRATAPAPEEGKPLMATHRGNFQEEFGIDVECYVLDDERKTAVISKRGMGLTLGMGKSGSVFPYFISSEKMVPHVGSELQKKLDNPLIFQWTAAGANAPLPTPVHGYDVTILIEVCKAIIAADDAGKLPRKVQQNIVKQASVIVTASAKYGITQLVYALAGYDQTRAEKIAAFKIFVAEEARGYEKEFPDELYEAWYRLYQIRKPERNKPWKFKYLTLDHVYIPLARSKGMILTMTRRQRENSKERWKKLHQFLSEVGVNALRLHLGQLLGIAKLSDTKAQYERGVEKVFKPQTGWDF